MDIPYHQNTVDDTTQQSFLWRIAPALALFFLAPLTAEYLIGYLDATGDFFETVFGLGFLAPLYGGAALIIREVTRRSGRGWLTIILLATAFGIFQAGLVDHSLFSASYLNFEWWGETRVPTYIPLLGISGYYALIFIAGHIIWSISVPIVIVETFVPYRRTTPWLKNTGLGLTILIYVLMSSFIFVDHVQSERFLPTAAQLIGTALLVLVFVVAAFMIKIQATQTGLKSVPRARTVGIITLLLLNMTIIMEIIVAVFGIDIQFTSSWAGTIFEASTISLLAGFVWRWSRHKDWTLRHMLAVAGGALLTRAWIAFLVEPAGEVALLNKLMHNTIFFLGSCVLLYLASLRATQFIKQQNEKRETDEA